jgi:hypothetical protein
MESNKKLTQIKSFVKGKVYEFMYVVDEEILNNIDLSNVIIHLDNYSYDNYGCKLFSMKLKPTMNLDFETLENELTDICIANKLGLYVTAEEDDGESEILFFNKALNNHIKSYQLMLRDEREYIGRNIKQLLQSDSLLVKNNISKLITLTNLSNAIYMELKASRFIDEEDATKSITISGMVEKIGNNTLTIKSIDFASILQSIDICDDWEIVTIEHRGKDMSPEVELSIVCEQ